METPEQEGRPEGDGWVLITNAHLACARAVPTGIAVRRGARALETNRVASGFIATREDLRLDARTRGARDIARKTLRNWTMSGLVERDGDWVRLAREPVHQHKIATAWGIGLLTFLRAARWPTNGNGHC